MTKEDIESGLQYQDFIAIQLLQKLGWTLNQFASRKYQIEHGESISRIEIKNDNKMQETKNIYVELAEKTVNGNFIASGITRQDNTLFWLIGDYNVAYVFVKKQLKYLCDNYQKYGFKKVETETSIGILIPVSFLDAHDLYVVKKLEF